jgi:hypothetical protein
LIESIELLGLLGYLGYCIKFSEAKTKANKVKDTRIKGKSRLVKELQGDDFGH